MRTEYWFYFTFLFKRCACTSQVCLWISHWPWKSGIKMWWGGEKGTAVSNKGRKDAVEGSAMARITPGSKGSLDDSKTWWKWSQFRMISSLHFVSYVHTNMLRNEARQDENIGCNCKTNLRSAHLVTFSSFTFNNNDTKICTTLYSPPSGPATWQTASLHCPLCQYSIFEAKNDLRLKTIWILFHIHSTYLVCCEPGIKDT